MKPVDPAEADRSDRVAVIGVVEAHEEVSLLGATRFLTVVLEGDLQRDFDTRRTAVRIEDFVQTGRSAPHQFGRQLDARLVGQAEQC